MADPFEALRRPVEPVDPDPLFAARLRARLEWALDRPRGGIVPDLTPDEETSTFRPGDVAYASLWVPDVERAEAFFAAVLGWRYAPGSERQGRQVEGTALHQGLWGGQERATLFLCFAVDDVEAAVARVRAAGGRAGQVRQEPYGAVADCVDDQGTGLALLQVAGGAPGQRRTAAARHGDIVYLTLEVVDAAKARAFYGSVLDWRFAPGHVEDGWQVEGVAPMIGVVGGRGQATVVPMYRVDDVAAAVARVRAAGGSATEPERQPYGLSSACSDDQGTRFYLGQV